MNDGLFLACWAVLFRFLGGALHRRDTRLVTTVGWLLTGVAGWGLASAAGASASCATGLVPAGLAAAVSLRRKNRWLAPLVDVATIVLPALISVPPLPTLRLIGLALAMPVIGALADAAATRNIRARYFVGAFVVIAAVSLAIPDVRLRLAALTAAAPSSGKQEAKLLELGAAIGTEPLDEAGVARLAPQKEELEALTRGLEAHPPRKPKAWHDWQLGEAHRLRNLFDEQDAWEESERYLSLALAREPKMAAAHLSLGQLYLTGGFEFAPRAERELVRALEEAGGAAAVTVAAHRGLFLAYYYQGRWADSLKEADRYLAASGGDVTVRKMRDMAQTNLTQEKKTK